MNLITSSIRRAIVRAIFVGVVAATASAQQFQPAVSYTSDTFPVAVATGDFNGDSRPDIALACDGAVDIFISSPTGTFGKKITTTTELFAQDIAVADFNGDGKADVVLANGAQAAFVSVLLGNGDGTFQPAVDYPTGRRYGSGVAVADLNADGIPDIVATNRSRPGMVSVFIGVGDGTFKPAVNYPATGPERLVAIADFNHDGVLDLAVTGSGANVSVLVGNGDGTFQPEVDYTARFGAEGIVAGDFDNNGTVDLAVVDSVSKLLSVLLGNGDATFQPPKNHAIGSNATYAVAADFNRDGILDIVTTDCNTACTAGGTGSVQLLLGKGDGTFSPRTAYPVGSVPLGIATADFNGDGAPDLVVANSNGRNISVLLNTGSSH